MDKLTISVPETAKLLGISRNLAYELARIGRLPVIRLGKCLVVPRMALDELLKATGTTFSENRVKE